MVATTEAHEWKAIGLLVDRNARDLLEDRYGVFPEVVSWFKVIRIFRQAETDRMIEREPTPEDLQYHRTQLDLLIAEGSRLLSTIHEEGPWPANAAGIKVEDIQAAVEDLRITQREWHEPLSDVRKSELWQGVFGLNVQPL
jgi:hypothetical protein